MDKCRERFHKMRSDTTSLPVSTARSFGRIALLGIFFASGAAGVGYQMVWAKMFANGLGHEVPAVLAVVCAFMAGMAIGAWVTARAIDETTMPARIYAALELLIGIWAIATCFLVPWANTFSLSLIGLEPSALRHWSVAFLLPLIVLLPATFAMGATFAAMERLLSGETHRTHSLGALYASNTAGAVAGILASTFVLMPRVGLRSTVLCLAVLNFGCAVLALRFGRIVSARGDGRPGGPSLPFAEWRLQMLVVFTGIMGIGLEVAGTRVLAQVLENTTFTFAAVLAVYLLGTAIGAAWYQRFGSRFEAERLLSNLLCCAAVACAGSILILSGTQQFYDYLRSFLGAGLVGAISSEIAIALCVLGPPTIVLGALFSHLFQSAKAAQLKLGNVFALNSAGSALAPVLINVVLFPLAGSKWTLGIVALGYLVLIGGKAVRAPILAGGVLTSLVIIFAVPTDLRLVKVPTGGTVVERREGIMASVAVVGDPLGSRNLRVNNRFQMGGTSAAAAEYRQAHLPLLLHPQPKSALFLGLGTGITFAAAGLYQDLEADGVELLPEVLEVKEHFAPYNSLSSAEHRLHIHVADARRWVRTTSKKYDVIVADLFHPARDGAGTLYTREHFENMRRCLAAGGMVCQWLPLHQMDEDTLRIILRTFLDVFPQAQAYLLHFNVGIPVLGLFGSENRPAFSDTWIETRLKDPILAARLKELSLADSVRFFGHFIGGTESLKSFCGGALLNTDDRQRVTFRAPLFAYRKGSSPYETLFSLLAKLNPGSVSEIDFGDARFSFRVSRFIEARNVYLRGLAQKTERHEPEAINSYIESAQISPDFTAGYAECLSIVSVIAREHPEPAKALLRRLIDAQPDRPVAREVLRRLEETKSTGEAPNPSVPQ